MKLVVGRNNGLGLIRCYSNDCICSGWNSSAIYFPNFPVKILLILICFPLITIALSISFTIKWRLFARKEWLAKRNKGTLISLCSGGRATSVDIGREFRPLRLAWWVLQGAQLWKGKRKRSHFILNGHIQCKQSLSPRSLELRGNFQMHRWSYIWEDTENRVISHTPGVPP